MSLFQVGDKVIVDNLNKHFGNAGVVSEMNSYIEKEFIVRKVWLDKFSSTYSEYRYKLEGEEYRLIFSEKWLRPSIEYKPFTLRLP